MKDCKLLIIALFCLACGMAQAQQRLDFNRLIDAGKDIASAATGISEKEEIDIGRGLAGRMLGQVELVNDANVQAYVNRVGRWVASQSERPDLPWRFGVANAPNINAMAMPGGAILITRGLYDILDNEAQLAGVLGHEIAHVVKRHHINVMRQQRLVSAGANLAAARSGSNELRQLVLDFFKKIFISGLDKNSEYEADAVGVILAARAGYNAFGLAEVLHKLNARGASDPSVVDLFGSHPVPSDRLAKLGELLTPRLEQLSEGLEPALMSVAARAGAPSRARAPASVPGAKALINERAATKPAPAAAARAQKPVPVPEPVMIEENPGTEPAEVAPDATAEQKPASPGLLQRIKGFFSRSSESSSEAAAEAPSGAPAEAETAEAPVAEEPAQKPKPAGGGFLDGIRGIFGR
ncbi:MAG: M48 family metalloprotease [Burkholderiales bacterium]